MSPQVVVILVILGKTEHKNPHLLTNQKMWFCHLSILIR